MKKTLHWFLALLSVILIFSLTIIETSVSSLGANGKLIDNKTFVPVRGVFEELGFSVKYDNMTEIATIQNDIYTIKFPKNETYFLVNNKTIIPDQPQKIINDTMYIPLRAVSDSIGATINWDSSNRTAIISYDKCFSLINCYDTETPNTINSYYSKKLIPAMKNHSDIPDFSSIKNTKLIAEYYCSDSSAYKYDISKVKNFDLDTFFKISMSEYNFESNSELMNTGNLRNLNLNHSSSYLFSNKDKSKTLLYVYSDNFCTFYLFNNSTFDINFTTGKFYINNTIFNGEIKNNIPNGKGEIIFKNIGTYSGNFTDGKRNGFGIFSWNDGDTYKGNWKDDKMDGLGTYTFASGKILDGQWKSNKFIESK